MPNIHNDYDTLIEYLRLKRLNEMSKYWRIDSHRTSKGKQGSNRYEKQSEDYYYKSDADKGWAPYIR